jgi:hypothetical protein
MENKQVTPKKNKVTKKLQKFIDSISNIVDTTGVGLEEAPQSYVSKIDGSYLTFVGLENNLKFLLKNGITENVTSNLGFNPIEQKWYGWSHRAIFGFGIRSQCKKGDCGYEADNKENFAQSCLDFWGDKEYSVGDNKFEFGEGLDYWEENKVKGVWITYTYNDKVPNDSLKGTEYKHFSQFPDKWGRGQWTARTLDEAKEMALDFAKGVS